jgi:hypothetical protein
LNSATSTPGDYKFEDTGSSKATFRNKRIVLEQVTAIPYANQLGSASLGSPKKI